MSYVFEVADKTGRKIHLSKERWAHIRKKHPEIEDLELINNMVYNIYYDEEADFLEVFIGEPSECYAEEAEKGVFIRKDKTTNEIKSIGIFSFRKQAQLLREVLKKNNLRMSLSIGTV